MTDQIEEVEEQDEEQDERLDLEGWLWMGMVGSAILAAFLAVLAGWPEQVDRAWQVESWVMAGLFAACAVAWVIVSTRNERAVEGTASS